MAALRVVQEEIALYQSKLPKEHVRRSFFERVCLALKTLFFPRKKLRYGRKSLEIALENLEKARQALPEPAAIDTLSTIFGLSVFEQKVLLMCAGVELDTQFSKQIAAFNGGQTNAQPTFSLALAAFEEAHWSAISPAAPLRYWHLVELSNGAQVTKSGLKIDERILHYITGVPYLEGRLQEILEPIFDNTRLEPSQMALVNQLLFAFSTTHTPSVLPVVQLIGDDKLDKTAVASAACVRMQLNLYSLSAYALPNNTKEMMELLRLWNREAALNACALFLDGSLLDMNDKLRVQLTTQFIENIQGVIILSGGEWGSSFKRPKLELQVKKPTEDEQFTHWQRNFSEITEGIDGALEEVVAQFNLSSRTIDTVSLEVLTRHRGEKDVPDTVLTRDIWKTCSQHTRPKIDELAQRIETVATWNNIVLPPAQAQILREVAMQVRQRKKVYREWGFDQMGARGLGISALFTGESGTGKTMASEVLANELQLDLYKIDLSQVVNKYIGETEKNLKRIFDAAEEGGAILLFDEADALFGKRSDVKDSHDRYSNIEVSYLLQRMESYSGLAVLTTNMKSAIDKAFLRRIRFVIPFPYPDTSQRLAIWKGIFPPQMPRAALDFDKLARLNIAGGNIRNIAINAAFIAAEQGKLLDMSHILQAVRGEYNKLEKTLSANEIFGW